MRNLLKNSLVLICTIFFGLNISAKDNVKPDFAYPKQVILQAETNLNKALKEGNGNAVVRSLIDYSIAQSLINTDSIQVVINKIEQVATKEKDPCTKALLNTLLIEIYSDIYDYRSLTYDKRTNINTSTPLDISEWSGNDFKQKVFSLCDEALKDADALKKAKLSNYNDIITHNNLTFIYYPTLYDFVVYQLIENLNYFLPTYLQGIPSNIDKFLATPITDNGTAENEILTLYRDILSFHSNDIAALIHWDIERINRYSDIVPIFRMEEDDEEDIFEQQKAEALNYLFKKYKDNQYASIALIELSDIYQKIYSDKELYNLFSQRLKQYPSYDGNCNIENKIGALSKPSASILFNQQIVPNDTLEIRVNNTNCNSLTVDIIKIPDGFTGKNHNYYFKDGVKPEVYKTFEVKCDSTIPFYTTQKIKTTIANPGYYSVIVYNDEMKPDIRWVDVLFCSELYGIRAKNIGSDNRMWVLNPKTGEVITGANINIKGKGYINKDNKPTDSSFKSSRDGEIKGSLRNGYDYEYKISKGEDHYAYNSTFYYSNEEDTTWKTSANCFTPLPLYHPGDTVAWSAVIYQHRNNNEQRLASNKTYSISFRDANYMQIDTAIVSTDNFGRIEGKFAIPTDRMTGEYSINIIGKHNSNISRCRFMVSDYKLPTFEIKIEDVNKLDNGNYIISGEVRSFSGFAMDETSLDLDLKAKYYDFFYRGEYTSIYTSQVTTDENGKFSFTIPPKDATLPGNNKLLYRAEITATSSTGESQQTTTSFTNGNPYYIYSNSQTVEASKNTKLNVNIYSIVSTNPTPTDATIYYSIINKDKVEVKNGSFPASNAIVDLSDVASGEYNIKLHSVAPTATDTFTYSLRLYRTTDALPPIDNGLWIQKNEYIITKDNSIDIVYGSTFNSGDILYLLYDNDKIYETRWIKAKKGIHKTRVFIPQHIKMANVTLFAINDYNNSVVYATIKRASNNDIKITAQSFRDKITPGSEEQWTFSVTDTKDRGKESAMIMNMYSLAIEKLSPHSINVYFHKPFIYNYIFSYHSLFQRSYSINGQYNSKPCREVKEPYFDTYGKALYTLQYNDKIMVRALSSPKRANYVTVNAMGMTGGAVEESADSEVLHEVVETKKLNLATTSSAEDSPTPNIPLRENETPLAFFRPMLTTDTLGNLTFSFTVPNANTTWLFNAIAYNDEMKVADFAREVMANKPIMVQPNMPRFLRQGDNAIIKASIMNNSDSTMAITTIIELFDPSTAKVVATHTHIDTILAAQSTIASIDITTPNDATMIGYRIKSFCDNFGDGEQSLIPILPATSPVIESTTFYIGANEHSYTQQLPSIPADARVTLEFCENPTWYAVTALPGLNKNQSRTSISAAMAIYSAAIANGIIRQNPQIANALYEWQHSDKTDSTLVSMLSRNQDLKNMLLSATPWMQNAENDTERMARLSLLFDKKEIKTTIDKNIHQLATLQRHGGGWAWIAENDESSLWSTLMVLEKFGHLKSLGYLPDNKDINTMIENAIKYLDAQYAQQYKKYPKADYSEYVLIRDFFPELKQSTAAQKVTASTIQQIISNWKRYSLNKKAISALILNNHDYSSTAREILNSINEFSQTSKSRGMWWPTIENNNSWGNNKIRAHANILDAYAQISPKDSNIDLMRQWLILNKEANDWGNSAVTSYVVYTLLNTGSQWIRNAVGVEITLGGETIPTNYFDKITGYVRTDISSMAPSGKKLTIAKHGNQPSWGAVYRQYNATMSEIKAVAGNDISIEKKLLKLNDNGIDWVETQDFNVGDKVRIQLTIKASRDIEYVTITDERAACFEPAEQLPRPIFAEGIYFYRENRDDATNIFVANLPKGTYLLNYDMYVNNEGEFSSGIATIQSQYAPQITAHSAGNTLNISSK